MRQIHSIWILLLVIVGTAAAVYFRWPNLEVPLGAGFAGLLLLHIHTHLRLAALERQGTPSPVSARSYTTPTASPPRKSRKRSKIGKSQNASVVPGRVVKPSSHGLLADSPEEQEKVEEFLKVVLDDDDGEEVSFLPPYVSGEDSDSSFDVGTDVTGGFGVEGLEEEAKLYGQKEDESSQAPVAYGNVPIPRHFALGTVAIIRGALTPGQVAEVLVEQRKQPKERFGDLAVGLGLLDPSEVKELLLAQQQGLFTDAEIQEARARIRGFREVEPTSATSS